DAGSLPVVVHAVVGLARRRRVLRLRAGDELLQRGRLATDGEAVDVEREARLRLGLRRVRGIGRARIRATGLRRACVVRDDLVLGLVLRALRATSALLLLGLGGRRVG